jgi:hypothetical protein
MDFFFNYVTEEGKVPPSPHGGPLLNYSPQSKFFSLKYKQNIGRKMEFRREV